MTTQPTVCPDWCMWRHEGHSPDFPDHTYDVYGFGEISQQPGHGAPLIWLGDRIAGKGMTAAEARSLAEMLQRGADDLDDQPNWRPSPPPTIRENQP